MACTMPLQEIRKKSTRKGGRRRERRHTEHQCTTHSMHRASKANELCGRGQNFSRHRNKQSALYTFALSSQVDFGLLIARPYTQPSEERQPQHINTHKAQSHAFGLWFSLPLSLQPRPSALWETKAEMQTLASSSQMRALDSRPARRAAARRAEAVRSRVLGVPRRSASAFAQCSAQKMVSRRTRVAMLLPCCV